MSHLSDIQKEEMLKKKLTKNNASSDFCSVWISLILKINHMKINEISFSVFLFVLLKEANVYKYITIKWLISQDITPTYSMYAFPYDTE